jgi:hypothetical protein
MAPDNACRATLKPIIKAGDVLLTVNGVPLFDQTHAFSRDSAVSAIQKAPSPRWVVSCFMPLTQILCSSYVSITNLLRAFLPCPS